jgi:hypothetical protein
MKTIMGCNARQSARHNKAAKSFEQVFDANGRSETPR